MFTDSGGDLFAEVGVSISFLNPFLLSLPPQSPLNPARGLGVLWAPQRVCAEPDCQTFYYAFWAENHDFGDTKLKIN